MAYTLHQVLQDEQGLTDPFLVYQLAQALFTHPQAYLIDARLDTRDFGSLSHVVLGFIETLQPWFYVTMLDTVPTGAIWVTDFEDASGVPFAASMGGIAFPRTNPAHNQEAFSQVIEATFNQCDTLEILRSRTLASNRAAKRFLYQVGFIQPEPIRGMGVLNGELVDGINLSITRTEWLNRNKQQEPLPDG